MRGSSGATIRLFDTYVRKTGDERVGRQGAWLMRHLDPAFPVVFDVAPKGYTMERLTPIDVTLINVAAAAPQIIDMLEASCWREPPKDILDQDALSERVMSRIKIYASWLDDEAAEACDFIIAKRKELRHVTTHGDPTVDNLMLRPDTGGLVLIDPLPATPYAPDLLAVDLGKVLQSAAGWEAARYGFRQQYHALSEVEDYIGQRFGNPEASAAMCYAFVHVVRALPYLEEAVRREVIGNVLERIAGRLP